MIKAVYGWFGVDSLEGFNEFWPTRWQWDDMWLYSTSSLTCG